MNHGIRCTYLASTPAGIFLTFVYLILLAAFIPTSTPIIVTAITTVVYILAFTIFGFDQMEDKAKKSDFHVNIWISAWITLGICGAFFALPLPWHWAINVVIGFILGIFADGILILVGFWLKYQIFYNR